MYKNRNSRTLLGLFLTCLPLCLSGCYTTTIHSGKPAAAPSLEYDQKWHHGLVWGIAELSGPYDLSKICPLGWAKIKTETSFLNGFVEAVTSGVYAPQTITVMCNASEGPAAPSTSAKPAAPPTDTPVPPSTEPAAPVEPSASPE
ncbi:MAG: hypothetical protein SFV15_10485 [Polyangiaceae bacterium]|nr:hypothetical protein [Polyangiaceae bacterium]